MSESLYCPGQIVPNKEYLENYDKIEWTVYTLDQKGDLVYIGKDGKYHKYPKIIYDFK